MARASPPPRRQISATRAPWARTASGTEPTATARAAPGGPGSPSAARVPRSTSWSRLGSTAVSWRVKAASRATSALGKPNTHVASSAGIGWTRRCASTTTPKVPKEPTKSFGMS